MKDKPTYEELEKQITERVKELNCLHNIARVTDKPGITPEQIFEETVGFIPPSWQYPEITCARIIINHQEYKTDNFLETKWKHYF